uniref:uncharacterized protein n=1 Tax=Myxine glutinosa TaxID=7769 RepID=UPI00358FCF5F
MILNRLGHCESYDFGLELETAIAKALDEDSTYLTPQIIFGEGNVVFHSEWDNLNKITMNIHGSNMVNSAGGIMIQEITPDATPSTERTLPLYDRSKKRSLKLDTPETLPPSPRIHVAPVQDDLKQGQAGGAWPGWLHLGHWCDACQEIHHRLLHAHQPAHHSVRDGVGAAPAIRGGYARSGPEVHHQHLQSRCAHEGTPTGVEVSRQVKGPCDPPWAFHTSMNDIGMITNHKCRGSGYAENLLEAQLVTSGCLKSVLSDKAYAKALFCLKTVCEVLERLLLEVFIEEMNIQISPAALLNLIKSCNCQHRSSAWRGR